VIETVGVVVPAHNEETLLPACLTALRRAARQVSVPVHLLVAADSCTDRTVAVARACGAQVIRVRARSVGAARAAGMTELLRLTAGANPEAIWLATTDADTVVPPSWLQRQIAHADQGWDVVLGTVTVADWSEHLPHVPTAFAARYESGDHPHPHIHGANIGIRASAYQAAGGFRPLRTAEDHALLAAVGEAGCPVLRAGDVTVETSGRRHARAPHGFSHLLRTLAPAPQPWLSGLNGHSPARPAIRPITTTTPSSVENIDTCSAAPTWTVSSASMLPSAFTL
jgi:Glycosyl transferase family 2